MVPVAALWDTSGTEVVRELAAARRSDGVTSGLVLTLIAVVDERPGIRTTPVKAVEDAATVAAAAHPCRLLVVTRSPAHNAPDRLDAEIVVGGRLGPCEAVIMRMQGRLALHAESVVMPLLAPDVPVVTWWHGPPPEQISTDPLGVVAERRITDCAQAEDPVAALRQRALDYAAGDTDLAWTRLTGWRTLVAGAVDRASGEAPVATAARLAAPATDASGALMAGWLGARLGVTPARDESGSGELESVHLALAGDGEAITGGEATTGGQAITGGEATTGGSEVTISGRNGTALLRRSGHEERAMPLLRRTLGEELAEELRRLGADQSYAAALSAATGVSGLAQRPSTRVHTWVDPAESDQPAGEAGSPGAGQAGSAAEPGEEPEPRRLAAPRWVAGSPEVAL